MFICSLPSSKPTLLSVGALPLLDFRTILWRWELSLLTTLWRETIFPFFPGKYQGCFLEMGLEKELDRGSRSREDGLPGDCPPDFWIQQFQQGLRQALDTVSSSFGKGSMSPSRAWCWWAMTGMQDSLFPIGWGIWQQFSSLCIGSVLFQSPGFTNPHLFPALSNLHSY